MSDIKYESLGDMLKDGKCHNALAELSERLASNEVRFVEGDEFPIHLSKNAILDFRKARRIVAELAKVKRLNEHGQTYMIYRDETQAAYEKCSAIAEE